MGAVIRPDQWTAGGCRPSAGLGRAVTQPAPIRPDTWIMLAAVVAPLAAAVALIPARGHLTAPTTP